jgi:two-component system LytT family response regulator
MTPISVLVVDDEKPGRERLRRLLSRDARVKLAGCCAGGAEALARVRDAELAGDPVRVLFLDVQMPEIDGFAVVSALVRESETGHTPAVVFVTAHDEYALRAFDAHAIDYLLKPFSDERFEAALDRTIRHVSAGDAHALLSRLQALLGTLGQASLPGEASSLDTPRASALDRIVVKDPNRVRLVPVEQISWIEAQGMYVKLHMRDGSVHLQRGLLHTFDSALDERCFLRIHRSAIVNIDVVQELRQDEHGDYIAVLRDRTEIRVGRRFRPRLQARLGQPL